MQTRSTILIPIVTESRQEVSRSFMYISKISRPSDQCHETKWHEDRYLKCKAV